jgi:4'-phosphopantetheinyl transferase
MVWVVPGTPPPLGVHEAHLWRLDLDAATGEASATDILNEEERARAARFHFERDRHRFMAGRAALRRILAAYLDRSPDDLVFAVGPHGKPALENLGLEFNLSHSGGCGLLAVTRGRRVGVDVERVRADFAGEDIARRFFAPAEVEALAGSAPDQYATGFFRCWTRKEAYVKARGDGLSLALDRFEVPLDQGATRALASCLDDPSECARWSLREVVPAPGYLGALVVEGDGWTLQTYA